MRTSRTMVLLASSGGMEEESSPLPMSSPRSPTNLKYARSHAELSGRKSPSPSEGVSLREPLETEDYWNWE